MGIQDGYLQSRLLTQTNMFTPFQQIIPPNPIIKIKGLMIVYALKEDNQIEVRIVADKEPELKQVNRVMVEGAVILLKNLLRDHLKGADAKDPYFEDVGLKTLAYHQKLTKEFYEGQKQNSDSTISETGMPKM